jgi:hypothetical protein
MGEQIKNYNLHYAICLIFALHKHGVFIDQNYIAGSFGLCLSKIWKHPLMLKLPIKGVENVSFLINSLRPFLELSFSECEIIHGKFQKCSLEHSGANPIILLAYHVYMYKVLIKEESSWHAMMNVCSHFYISEKSLGHC